MNNMIDTELRQKYSPDGSELRRCQLRMLEMLKFFDSVCKNNNLRYWIDSGTLLGAVRHGGFIPWDDDIDVCMMREDAMLIKKMYLKESISNEFVLQCHETDKGYYLMWDKIRDVKSENLDNSYNHSILTYKGLALDIFRVDDNSNFIIWKIFDKLVRWCVSYPLLDNNGIWNKFRFIIGPSFFFLSKVFYGIAYLFSFTRKKHFIVKSYGIPWYSEIPIDYVFPLKTIEFEGYSFTCPREPEKYLSVLYKDWRTLPPEQARSAHRINVHFTE